MKVFVRLIHKPHVTSLTANSRSMSVPLIQIRQVTRSHGVPENIRDPCQKSRYSQGRAGRALDSLHLARRLDVEPSQHEEDYDARRDNQENKRIENAHDGAHSSALEAKRHHVDRCLRHQVVNVVTAVR